MLQVCEGGQLRCSCACCTRLLEQDHSSVTVTSKSRQQVDMYVSVDTSFTLGSLVSMHAVCGLAQ